MQEWCHSTQKGHKFDDWQVMRSKSREVFTASGVARPTRWIFVVSPWTQQAVYYTLERWLVGFTWKNKQTEKSTKAWFKKKFLHEAFHFSDGSICKQPKQFSVHYVCLSRQFEFNLPARETLFARLSVIIAVLLCLPVCLHVRDRESVL